MIKVATVLAGLAAIAGGTARAQTVEFRIVERQGQLAIVTPVGATATTDATLNFAIQARVVGGAAGTYLGNFEFTMHIVGEPEANGTLAKLLTSNSNGTYAANTQQATNASVGRGGLAAPYTYLAGITTGFFNGLINVSGGSFTNGPDQEIMAIAGSPTGNSLLLVTDLDGDGNPDTYTGPLPAQTGARAPLDPAIGQVYFGMSGNWVDVYRFRYVVSNVAEARVLHFTLEAWAEAEIGTELQLSNGVWGPVQANAAVSVQGLDVPVGPVGACCDNATGLCAMVDGTGCGNGRFAASGTCTPSPCTAGGTCCLTDGSCVFGTPVECAEIVGSWTIGGSCAPNSCPQPLPCCRGDGSCTLVTGAGCIGGTVQPGFVCVPNPCPQPQPCCAEDGSCTMVLASACRGDTMAGTCAPNPCPQPGACCVTGLACQYMQHAGCGTTWIANATCSPNPCPPWGACCDSSGACQVRLQSVCTGAFFVGSYCSSTVCPVLGACCEREACTLREEAACAAVHGQYRGNRAACIPAGLPNACCIGNYDGVNGVQVADIFAFLGAWFAGDPRADVDLSGTLTVYDIFGFIGHWRDDGCR